MATFVRRGIKLRTFLISAVYLMLTTNFVNAGPFIESGDHQLRSDLQVLNDNGVLNIQHGMTLSMHYDQQMKSN